MQHYSLSLKEHKIQERLKHGYFCSSDLPSWTLCPKNSPATLMTADNKWSFLVFCELSVYVTESMYMNLALDVT